ncbi:MAG: hypothetical protein ACKOAH_19205, partial [Pirellula sp.]
MNAKRSMAMTLRSWIFSSARNGLIAIAWLLSLSFCIEAQDASRPTASVLRLQGGDTYRGSMVGSKTPQELSWNCPSFLDPIVFPWDSVQLVQMQESSEKTEP